MTSGWITAPTFSTGFTPAHRDFLLKILQNSIEEKSKKSRQSTESAETMINITTFLILMAHKAHMRACAKIKTSHCKIKLKKEKKNETKNR